jgi:hypothetical protein
LARAAPGLTLDLDAMGDTAMMSKVRQAVGFAISGGGLVVVLSHLAAAFPG